MNLTAKHIITISEHGPESVKQANHIITISPHTQDNLVDIKVKTTHSFIQSTYYLKGTKFTLEKEMKKFVSHPVINNHHDIHVYLEYPTLEQLSNETWINCSHCDLWNHSIRKNLSKL